MVTQTKEACQEIFTAMQVYGLSRTHEGLQISDMEAIFGRLARANSYTGGDHGVINLEGEQQERVRVFNFTESPLTRVGQDGIRQSISPVDIHDYSTVVSVSSIAGLQTPGWFTALTKTQDKPQDLNQKIVIVKSRVFTGYDQADLRRQLKNCRLSAEDYTKLTSSKVFSVYYGGKKKIAIYAMFMFVVDIQEFAGHLHLHERASDTFVSLADVAHAPAHPWDVHNQILDYRAMDNNLPKEGVPILTYRFVYHEHRPRVRYLREGSSIVELLPQKDLTTREGFYKTCYVPSPLVGVQKTPAYWFVELEKITEEAGFYLSKEAAEENMLEKQLIEKRKVEQQLQEQQLKHQEQICKATIQAIQSEIKTNIGLAKDYYSRCLFDYRDDLTKETAALRKERDAAVKELEDYKRDLADRKRLHEDRMFDRKEKHELLKFIPNILSVVGAILIFSQQKGKKK